MLTLDPASACEVCAEPFGPGHIPAVIPCGHVFCAKCLSTIVDKTARGLTPSCPLCRGGFTDKTWRLIRVDLGDPSSGSGWSGNSADMKEDEVGKLLEGKVAQAASKKCSFEEVSALHKEVQDWLSLEPNKPDPQHASLRLSADLLRAILLNCLAYSEATKIAKSTEVSLREQLDMYKAANERIESELKKQRSMYTAKSRECQQLRAELSRYRPQDGAGQSSSRSTSAPPRPATSLGTSPAAAPSVNVPGMSNTLVQATSRPSTAAAYGTSSTTVSFPRSAGTIGTVSPPISPARRSPSPAPDRPPPAPVPPLARLPNTPSAPVASKLPSLTRSATPGPMSGRSSTPGPFQRSASVAGHRSNSKHQIWIPSPGADDVPAVPPLPQSSSSTRSRFLSMASRPSKNN